MRYILLSAIPALFAALSLFAQTQSEEEEVSAAKAFERYKEWAHPTPEREEEDRPYAIPHALIPMIEATAGSAFLNVNLIEPETDPLPVQNESSIAVNPKNPLNLIASAVDYRANSSTWVYVSQDGGKTWKDINLGKPFPDWTSSNDPSVTFDVDGRGYLCYGGFPSGIPGKAGQNGVFLAITGDGGKTWNAHIPVILHSQGTQTPDSAFEDKYYVTVDNSPSSPYFKHLYIPWKRVTNRDSATQIILARSSDGGLTWSVPVPVSNRASGTSEDTTFGQSFPISVTGPNGEVYVAWNYGPKHSIGFASSTDGGLSFSTPTLIQTYEPLGVARKITEGVRHTLKGGVRVESYPTLACDITNGPHHGTLYLCWSAGTVPDIFFSRSTDGGKTWSTPVVIHSTANDQFWPWMSIDPTNGDLGVMYLDSRDDPNNIATQCYVSYSHDGGQTWVDRRAADAQSDIRKNPFAGNSFAGDYSGNAFFNGIIYPSCFDTRNYSTSSSDDDVYTAIINTRAPNPVENFTATIYSAEPQKVHLSWQAPTQRTFGQPLASSEFTYTLYRDNSFYKNLPSGTTVAFDDEGLTSYTKYEYAIAVIAPPDTSVFRLVPAYPGGAAQPDAPKFQRAKGSSDLPVTLTVRIPSVRADKITAFVNLKSIRIYRDDIFVSEVALQPTDTTKILDFTDTPPERGYYRYRVTVQDNATPAHESDKSDELVAYTGPLTNNYEENFDSGTLPRYINSGNWTPVSIFSKSPSYSLTESPDGNYKPQAADTVVIFPVTDITSSTALEFWHAAIIDPSDTGFVEVSRDNRKTWERMAAYNENNYAPWADHVQNNDDWKLEHLPLSGVAHDTLFIRFRFKANFAKSDDGWYIDDIRIGNITAVEEPYDHIPWLEIFPNPVHSRLTIRWNNALASSFRYSVTDMLGRTVPLLAEDSEWHYSTVLDVSDLAPGVYVLHTLSHGKHSSVLFTIAR